MRHLLASLLAIIVAYSAVARQPNLVFLLVDDWGYTDAGILGSDFYETPNIDRFTASGVRFTNAYAASPVCSPTRAAIMTGHSPASLKMTIWHEGAIDGGPRDRKLIDAVARPNLPREATTIAELLRDQGYRTAHIGKWHLGKAAYYPETQGYDINIGGTYWGAPATFHYPFRGVWSASDPELRYVPVGPGKPGDYLTDRLTDHALDWIDRQTDQPFLLSLWFHTVHTPIEGKPDSVKHFAEKPPGKRHRHAEYAAMIKCLDDSVGRVLGRLKDRGFAEDTIVILTSDNGGVDFPTQRASNRPPTSNHPLRSGKGTLYEGGIRVPLMIRWPGVTQSDQRCDAMVISQDFLPTIASGIGIESSEIPMHEGTDLMPLLRNPQTPMTRQTLYWHYPHYYTRMTPGSAIRSGDWKLIHDYEDDTVELYNLASDVGEQLDVSASYADLTSQLLTKLNRWREQIGANEPKLNSAFDQSSE